MGHTRLGTIPKSKKWRSLVQEMAEGSEGKPATLLSEDIEQIASQTLDAVQGGLRQAVNDVGLQYTFYLLTQLVLSARRDDWYEALAQHGIRISKDDSLYDLTAEFQGAIDDYLVSKQSQTDTSEIAQKAAGEAIVSLAGPQAFTLFGSTDEELRLAVRPLSTKKGFADLGQLFFGKFIARFLNFYLSRVTASQIDSARLHHIGDISKFNEALETHCYQSAKIVRDFSGEWYSRTEYLKGIDLENTSGFMAVALRKLQEELRQQGGKE
jgi:hypothetical protein